MATASLTPLPINTGGNLPHDQVVGRDTLMATGLEKLANQSVIIGAERRMGKTSLLRKLEAEANDKAFVICYRSVETRAARPSSWKQSSRWWVADSRPGTRS